MKKGEIVGNIFIIDVKDRGRLQMSKINMRGMRGRLQMFIEGPFTLNT
jgi:hypothetical protein